jgi:hypothetical protein
MSGPEEIRTEPLTEEQKCEMLMQKINGIKGAVDSHIESFQNELGEIYSRDRAEREQRMLRGTNPPPYAAVHQDTVARFKEARERFRQTGMTDVVGSMSASSPEKPQPVKKKEEPQKKDEKPFLRKRRINW